MAKAQFNPLSLLLISVALGSVGQLVLKHGIAQIGGLHAAPGVLGMLTGALRAIFTPYIFLGFAFYGLSSLLWLNVLSQVKLSTAYPMIAVGYVLVVILSAVFLREKVSPITVAGLFFICLGVSLIGVGANR